MKKILLLLIGIGFRYTAGAQCNVTADATELNITCGESVILSHSGSTTGNISFHEDFNNNAATGWAFTQQATFTNPCSPGGVDGTTHIWMGDQSGVPRTLETLPLNFGPAVAPAGGTICFDMLFAEQGNSSPCEGPDEPDEGVYLQYSIDNGATWVTINYFDPNGGNDPDLVNWNNWCFPIPAGALINGVKFRWFQDADSGAEYDHWGIDNVEIIVNDPNVTYTWSHDGYTTNLPGSDPTPVAPHTTTTYTVTMTTSNGSCTQSVTVVVTNPVVQVNAGPDLQVCPGQCVDMQATASVVNDPGGIKTFSNNQTEDFDASVFGGASVNVNVQGLNMDNVNPGSLVQVCITNLDFSGFGLPPSGVEALSLTLTCPDGTNVVLVPIGGAPAGAGGFFGSPSSYQNVCFVSTGGATLSAVPAANATPITGTFNSSQPLTGMNGCTANGVWSISVSTNAFTGSGTFDGWSITFDDEIDSYTPDIVWTPTTYMTPGEQTTLTPTVCPTVNTTYTITASDTAGCVTVSDNAIVTTDGICCALTIDNIAIQSGDCGTTGTGTATITYSGETTGLQFSIDGGTTFQASNIFSNLAPGTYQVQIIDDANCAVNQEIVIPATNGPTITNVATVNPTCGNNNGSITITASGGTGTLDYSINNGTTTQAGNSFPNLAAGTFQVLVTDDNGCEATQSVQLSTPNAPVINSAPTTNADCNLSNGSVNVSASGGVGTLDYSIDGGAPQATGLFSGLAPGDYEVTVTDDNGCEFSQNITIAQNPGPSITSVTPTAPNCGASDGSIVVVATSAGTVTYSIDNGTTTQPTGTFNNLPEGTYQVVVEDVNGCNATQQVILNTSTTPNVNAGADITICAGESVTLTATGAATYAWTGGVTNGVPFTPATTATYTVTGTDAAGCVNTDAVTVTVVPVPDATFTSDVLTGNPPLTVVFTNNSTNATSYTWNFGNGTAPVVTTTNGNQTSTFNEPGTYTVQLTAVNGSCTDIFTLPIIVLGYPPFEMHVPNVFTPNGDNANDEFWIDVKNGKTISVTIFNRWGNQMFEMDDFADKWNGKDATEGVYFFKYAITDLNGKLYEGHGHVTLIRK